MMTNPELDKILAEAGRDHRAVNPPDRLEPILRVAAESRKNASASGWPRINWIWAAVAILMMVAIALGSVWRIRKIPHSTNQQVYSVPSAQGKTEAMVSSGSVTGKKDAVSISKRVSRPHADRTGQRTSARKQPSWSPLDEFVPLPVSEGLAPASDLSVVRVKVKGSDLQQYGFDAPADVAAQMMLAEFVIGEDGLPRAIRIVR